MNKKETPKDFSLFTINGQRVFHSNFECYIRYYKGRLIAEDGYGQPYFLKKTGNKIVELRKLNDKEQKSYFSHRPDFLFWSDRLNKKTDIYEDLKTGWLVGFEQPE